MYPNLCRYAFISSLIHSVWSQGSAKLTFSSNPVYSQDQVTLTCSWFSGIVLSVVTVEASHATLTKGSLSCTAASPTCATGAGVFNGASFNGWPIAIGSTNVSLALTAAPSLELNYSCTVRFFNDSGVYSMTSEPAFLQVQEKGSAQLTFSSNPVYSQDRVTLTCSWFSGIVLSVVTVEASDATLKKGSLFCTVPSPTCATGIGVFTDTSINGWPISIASTKVSLTLTAAPSLELNYSCTVTFLNTTVVSTVTSETAFLQVQVCPSTPMFQPSPVAFIDSGNGNIICEARNGKPAALVSFTVSDIRGRSWASENFTDLATRILPQPLSNFHNATVTCRVTNHNCSNMSVTTVVFTTFNTSAPDVVCTSESNVMLNCSKHIWSYPGILYKWTVPEEANVNGSLDVDSLTVSQGQSGLFNCTATNNYSMASVVIIFTVSSVCHPITTPILTAVIPPCDQCWIIGLVLGIIAVVVIAVVLGILCKRGQFLKGLFTRILASGSLKHNSDVGVKERSHVTNSANQEYDSLDFQRSNEHTYAHLVLENNSTSTNVYQN